MSEVRNDFRDMTWDELIDRANELDHSVAANLVGPDNLDMAYKLIPVNGMYVRPVPDFPKDAWAVCGSSGVIYSDSP